MTEFIEILVSYISIWLPSLVSILGVAATVITAINKSKKAIEEFKDNSTLKELYSSLKQAISENAQLREQNALLLDQITQIKGYVDVMKKKKGG